MSVKACFIGNSHLSAVKTGWNRLHEYYPDVDITFFGSKSRTLRSARLLDGKIVSDDPQVNGMFMRTAGTSVIDVGSFDVVCLVGLALNSRLFVRFVKSFSLVGLDVPGTSKVSQDYLAEFFEDRIRGLLVSNMLDLVTEAGAKKIFVMPEPNTSQFGLTDVSDMDWQLLRTAFSQGVTSRIHDILKMATVRALGSRASVIPQPDDTIFEGLFTRGVFSDTATLKAILGGSAETRVDTVHMNGDYGVLMINRFLEAIGVAVNDEATRNATRNQIDEEQLLQIQKVRSHPTTGESRNLQRRKALRARRARRKAREEGAASEDSV